MIETEVLDAPGVDTLEDPESPAPAPGVTPAADKTADDKKDEEDPRDKQIRELRAETEKANKNAQFWADRARARGSDTEKPADDEEDDQEGSDDTPVVVNPDQDLDDIAKKGIAKAVEEKGFVTKKELGKIIRDVEERTTARVRAERSDDAYEQSFKKDFPELYADAMRVAKGLPAETPMYERMKELVEEMGEHDPNLKGSKSILIFAARQAKKELGEEGSVTRTAKMRTERRQRIEQSRPAGGRQPEREEGAGGQLTSSQLEVARALGVAPDKYRAQARDIETGKTHERGRR